MTPGTSIARFATKHKWLVMLAMIQVTLLLAALAALPTRWPDTFRGLNGVKIDTDPENMLPEDEHVRVYHDHMTELMTLHDIMVVGVVNDEHPEGVFNPQSLERIQKLTRFAQTLQWPDPSDPQRTVGVIPIDIIAPSTVDFMQQGGPATVTFEWLMREPPTTDAEALAVREKAQRIPFLDGTLVSDDGKAIALYLPLTSKDLSNRVYVELQREIATYDGADQFHITGLPVAEDVFGVEMFKQMAVSAPVAMIVIFLLMLVFFRKIKLIISPLIIAIVCVISTMALLVITGNTIHIMSSMIPIFIMPIAVLDAVHILSEFFDRYQANRDRQATIIHVMDTLFWPMLYTTLTTAVGFGSLALAPIPPVQVFGLFVAIGVLLAFLWTLTFIPAYVMFLSPASLENFGARHTAEESHHASMLSRILARTGRLTTMRSRMIILVSVIVTIVAVFGITRIQINDNPVNWFKSGHPIRVADRVLNQHFGGTYMAYLSLEAKTDDASFDEYLAGFNQRIQNRAESLAESEPDYAGLLQRVFGTLQAEAAKLGHLQPDSETLLAGLEKFIDEAMYDAPDEELDVWDYAYDFISAEQSRGEVFKQPEVLRFIEGIQSELLTTGIVGKSNSLADIVKTVHREFRSGDDADYVVPATAGGVAEMLIQYQGSHRPQDLWHFVTPEYDTSVLWVQLRSGDNRDMAQVAAALDAYMAKAPQPEGFELRHQWFGLTYINVVWQDRMVSGMLHAFLGSFLIVFLMMTILYRSALWGLLSMVPLTVTIGTIYGAIGLAGKEYDMPVAVLSSLSLGLAVDYAIHFLSRSRAIHAERGSWGETAGPMFGEPARAITRNVVVVGVGFLPLLAAPLMPHRTVGLFIASILVMAGLATLLILPSLITLLERFLFPRTAKCCLLCNCMTCIISGAAVIGIAAINVQQFLAVGWTSISWVSLVALIVLSQVCYFVGKSKQCRMETPVLQGDNR